MKCHLAIKRTCVKCDFHFTLRKNELCFRLKYIQKRFFRSKFDVFISSQLKERNPQSHIYTEEEASKVNFIKRKKRKRYLGFGLFTSWRLIRTTMNFREVNHTKTNLQSYRFPVILFYQANKSL